MHKREELKLVKNALENYKSCLLTFKREKAEKGFYNFVFVDINKEIKNIEDLLPKLKLRYRCNKDEANLMYTALNHYKSTLTNVKAESMKKFPNLKCTEIEKLIEKEIPLIHAEIEDEIARRRY